MKRTEPIHCLLDCLSHGLRSGKVVDDRPLYIGVWNEPFAVTEQGIRYYGTDIGVNRLIDRFELLYGQAVQPLLDPGRTKLGNYALLKEWLLRKQESETSLIMVDLFYLPYSTLCYRRKHRPHIIMADHMRNEDCWLIDPFFSYEGYMSMDILRESYYCGNFRMSFVFDKEAVHPPGAAAIARLLEAELPLVPSSLIIEIEAMIRNTAGGSGEFGLPALFASVEESGVIAKRWNGYAKVYSYLADELHVSAEAFCDKVTEMMRRWESALLSIIRIGMLNKREGLVPLLYKLDQISRFDISIRKQLWEIYEQWVGWQSENGELFDSDRVCRGQASKVE